MLTVNEPPAKKPSGASQGMMLTSEQHARLAEFYARPDPRLSPELAQWRQRLARNRAALSRAAFKRAEAKVPNMISASLSRARIDFVGREARLTSEQHAKLAEVYGKLDPNWSEGLVQRRQRLAHYHTCCPRRH
jgi:hypothetical protein